MFWAWCSLLIRSGLILATAELLRRLSHRRAARDRHRIMLAAFALLLACPLLSACLPEISIPLGIYPSSDGVVTIQQAAAYLRGNLPRQFPVNWPLVIWVAGVVLTFAPVIAGHFNLRRLVRRATDLHDESWQGLLQEECSRLQISKNPKLLIYSGPVMPLTFGLRRAAILLPADCLQWPAVRRRAVLVHELAHIRRRDVAWQFFANFIAALWWFQPLCWANRRSLRRESEGASDALVLESGLLPSEYARELLQISQDFREGRQWPGGAIAIAHPGELEQRLRAILGPPANRARQLPLATIAVLTALTVAASAVTIFPQQSFEPGGYNMKRTLISGLLVSAGLSAATVGNAAALPNTMGQGAAMSDSRATETQPSNNKVVRVGGNVAEKNIIKKVQPIYPASAKSAKIQGTVEIEMRISKEGVPEDLHIISSPSDDLAQSALDAVVQWRYRPTLLNGQPVEIITDVMVNYTLSS